MKTPGQENQITLLAADESDLEAKGLPGTAENSSEWQEARIIGEREDSAVLGSCKIEKVKGTDEKAKQANINRSGRS